MRLNNEEFKQLKELQKKDPKKLTKDEKELLSALMAKKKATDSSEVSFHPGNDFSWWNKEPSLMVNAANLKSKYIAGKPLDVTKIPYVVPGILRVRLCSAYGADTAVTDPINVWARDFYLKFFQKYRGASGFSASDLAITLFAENEIVKLIAKYERIYGIINRYSRLNANIPHSEVRGVGITQSTATYLRNHLSDFRYDLNVLIRKAQRLCIPKDLSSIADAISLFGYEYMDHESVRSQIVVFDLCKYFKYDETTLTTGGALFPVYIDGLDLFVEDGSANMCKYLDQALNSLLRSDSVQNILANMVVWFGEGSMLEFKPIPEDYVVVPVKDDTMLHKLHNIDVICTDNVVINSVVPTGMDVADKNILESYGDLVVYQFNDTIISKGVVTNSSGGPITYAAVGDFEYPFGVYPNSYIISNDCPHVLDTYRAEADPEVIVEGSLFKYAAKHLENNTKHCYVLESLALYYCYGFELMTATPTDVNTQYFNWNMEEDLGSDDPQLHAGYMAVIDWAPLFYSQVSGDITQIAGDIDNPILIYDNDMLRLHQSILYSAFKSDMSVIKG